MLNPNSDCDHNNPIPARNYGTTIFSSRPIENHYCPPTLSKKLEKLVLAELQVEEEQEEDEASSNNLTVVSPVRENAVDGGDCTTPKAKEHKIPDPMTCPPAPMKKRKAFLLPDKDRAPNKVTVTKSKFFASPELDTAFRINFSGN